MRFKAVVFDMDGTLLHVNSWESLHQAYGLDASEDRTMLRWYNEGVLDYHQWTELISRIYRRRGRATRENAVAAFERCPLDPAAERVLHAVHAMGLATLLLSGGIEELVSSVASRLGIPRFAGNHKMRFSSSGDFLRFDIEDDDRRFKVRELTAFCADQQLDPSECVCIGDGCNDAGIFELTGHGVLLCHADRSSPVPRYWRRVARLEGLLEHLADGDET